MRSNLSLRRVGGSAAGRAVRDGSLHLHLQYAITCADQVMILCLRMPSLEWLAPSMRNLSRAPPPPPFSSLLFLPGLDLFILHLHPRPTGRPFAVNTTHTGRASQCSHNAVYATQARKISSDPPLPPPPPQTQSSHNTHTRPRTRHRAQASRCSNHTPKDTRAAQGASGPTPARGSQ